VPQDVVAEREIEALPKLYARAVDKHDWDAVRAVFDSRCEIAGSLGTAKIDDYLPRIREFIEGLRDTMHNVTTCVVEMDGPDEAKLDSYSLAIYVDPLDGSPTSAAAVIYEDRVKRTQDGWKIVARQVHFPWRSA
jgi:3-phenylpropionate/cinnamic acid dioxygenase small subunit